MKTEKNYTRFRLNLFLNCSKLFLFFGLVVLPEILLASGTEAAIDMNSTSITGKIIDDQSGQPIEYASVAVYSAKDSSLVNGLVTDKDGNFVFKGVNSGNYFLKASFVGYSEYKSDVVSVSKSSRNANLGSVKLSEKNTKIDEVVVKGEKARVEYKIDKRIINVDKDINSKGGTAANVLENTPSVQVDAQGNVTLRGSSDFIVLIDGKPSVMKGSDALKQIPASAIKQVEVITNPSAKYDAEGQSGIINIVMKKDKLQGMNGSLNASAGNTNKRTGNILVNYRSGKANIFSGIDYVDNKYITGIDFKNRILQANTEKEFQQNTDQFNTHSNFSIKAGIDYDIDTMNSVTFSGNIGREGYDNGSDSKTKLYEFNPSSLEYFKSSNFTDVVGDVYGLNADYSHKFSQNRKISFTNTYYTWNGFDDNNLNELVTNNLYYALQVSSKLHYRKDNSNYNYRSNIDFQSPLFTGNFEAGAQFRFESRTDDMLFENFDVSSSTFIKNDTFSNHLEYKNTIYSGYSTYSNTVLGINYQVGLRGEVFLRNIDISNQPKEYVYNKFMFYPSVHLSKELNSKHQFQLSYSRRINRPQPWLLNNNPGYIDSKNIFLGSPEIKPEYTDAYEFNYRTTIKIFTFSTQTYLRNTTNNLQTLRYMNSDGKMYHKLINSESQQAYGVEQGIDVNICKWWQINSGANIYHYTLKTLIGSSEKVQEVNTWDARYINSFNTKYGTRLQSVFYYRAPSVDAVGESDGFYTVNLAISQPLFKGKGNIGLSAQNIFSSIKFDYKVKGVDFNNKYTIDVEGPVFMLNFSYSFNNFQNKNRGRNDDLQFKGGGAF